MLYQVEGDILFSKAQALVQGVSLNDPMDQGLAFALHNLFPEMHKAFHRWCHQHHPGPGEAWLWGAPNGRYIINLLTQEGGDVHNHRPGKATSANVDHALHALAKLIRKEKITSIALPRIATGVGGLAWEVVEPLIERRLGELDIPVYVYSTYHPGLRAKEPQP